MAAERLIDVEVVYATPEAQHVLAVRVGDGAAINDAIVASGILQLAPAISLDTCALGVFGRLRSPGWPLSAGDRVEIYRPLTCDPKAARRSRAAKKLRGGSNRD